MTIYKAFEQAKNGSIIPVFQDGRTMESRYNPERDASLLCQSIQGHFDFFLVLGIGSGIFLNTLSQTFPEARIIALELYKDDLDFLRQSELIKELEKNKAIKFLCLEELQEALIQNYIPAKYGDLKIIEQRGWVNQNKAAIDLIQKTIKKALGIISADYSVQSHFGKIWNYNILNNARLAQTLNYTPKIDTEKTGLLVAAGPTLDKSLSILKERDKYYVISTDTGAQSLNKHGILPDVILSIDGQNVSCNHFINCPSVFYAFDLCADFSAASHLAERGKNLSFFVSGHPLANAINFSSGKPLPTLFSGAGSVTITALDFAVKAGFKEILILGADFSYPEGKAYAKGTYLDALYNEASSKLKPSETLFSKLLYRTPLIKNEGWPTTQILQAYKTSLENYLISNDISFIKENDIYKLQVKKAPAKEANFFTKTGKDFSLSSFFEELKKSKIEEIENLLLPYTAWLRNENKDKNYSYSELLKLAFNDIVSYNG